VQVPSVVGGSIDGAQSALEAAGLALVQGQTVEVFDESQNGLIVDQAPAAGEWVDLGTTISVTVAVYVPPVEPPDES
jgi:serine/threonine-protein kinase